MIKWITNELGTAKKNETDEDIYNIIDVRDMVDKRGNSDQLILAKINAVIKLLKNKKRIVVCCDYGISRSNAIAVGVLVKYYGYDFEDAIKQVIKKTGEETIQLGILNSVKNALGVNYENKKKKNRKMILITGADNFIGKALVRVLKNRYDLIIPKKSELDLTKGPIYLDSMVKKYGANLIVHLDNPKIGTTTKSMGETIIMLKNVLDVCQENKIPLIFPSSWKIFAGYKNRLITVLSSLFPYPTDTYGQTRLLCETILDQYKKNYGVKVAILRFSTIYGLGGDEPKFIRDFIEKAKKNLVIYNHKYKNGFPVLDLLNIEDAVRAIELIIKKNFYGTISIGSGVGYSTFEIARKIRKLCCSNSKIIFREIKDFGPKFVMDIKETKKVLGWSPKITLEDGLKEIIKFSL